MDLWKNLQEGPKSTAIAHWNGMGGWCCRYVSWSSFNQLDPFLECIAITTTYISSTNYYNRLQCCTKTLLLSCFFRDLKASAVYVLLYNNLISEEKDSKSILMAGGVAGTWFSDPATNVQKELILHFKATFFYDFSISRGCVIPNEVSWTFRNHETSS